MEKATDLADKKMKLLAALHSYDIYAEGFNKIKGMGSRSINSSIGSQWKSSGKTGGISRVKIMDEYVKTVPKDKWNSTKLNIKMERCKA